MKKLLTELMTIADRIGQIVIKDYLESRGLKGIQSKFLWLPSQSKCLSGHMRQLNCSCFLVMGDLLLVVRRRT